MMRRATVASALVSFVLGGVLLAQPAYASDGGGSQRGPGWTVTVTIQTVPALADVRFMFDGVLLTTDSDGRTSYTRVHDLAGHTLELVDTSISRRDRRYRFARWAGQRDPDQAFRPSVTGLPLRQNYTITAGFSGQFPVTANFVDQHGRPVDEGKISAATIRSDAGTLVELPLSGTVWLEGSAPSYRESMLVAGDVSYSLQTVMVDGTNAVDTGRQRFRLAKRMAKTFTVPLCDLTITAHDAVFGTTAGTAAVVTGPDGTTRTVQFGADGTAHLTAQPQGRYRVDIGEPGGVVLVKQFTLSHDRTVDIAVVRWADLALAGAAGLLVAAGLLLVGRPHWRRWVRARLRWPARARRSPGLDIKT